MASAIVVFGGTGRVASARERGDSERGRHGDGGAGDMARSDDEDDEGDGGPAPTIVRTPAQVAFREKLVDHEREFLRQTLHARGRHVASQERQAVGLHWRYVMRLARIRELAEDGGDTATVARVDALLQRAEKRFSSKWESAAGVMTPGAPLGGHDGGPR